jgi:hypothetical protein
VKNKVVMYDSPKNLVSGSDYNVQVDDKELFLYKTKVSYPPYRKVKTVPLGYFDFEGSVIVKIKSPVKIHSVDIRPKSLGINASFDDYSITFELNRPSKVSIEINNSIDNVLHLFAGPIEENIPNLKDPNLIYFPPGEHYAGIIELKTGNTLYLAGGAYVHGMIHSEDAEGIKIYGRGILTSESIRREQYMQSVCIDILKVKNFTLHGITILDPANWSVKVSGCDEVDISNINIIGWRGNSDGIDICGSRDVKVNNCFIRNNDDGLVVKAFNTGDVKNIFFSNCILWNDFARPIEVGYENRADHIMNVHFNDIDIVHSLAGYPAIGIHEGDRAEIHDIFFEDIRIEDAPGGQIFDFNIKPAVWNRDNKPGKIYSIHLKNIYLNGKPGIERLPESPRIHGYSNESTIEDVTLENINILEKKVTNIEDLGLKYNEYTNNIRFVHVEALTEEQRIIPVQSRIEILKIDNIKDSVSKCLELKLTLQNLSLEYTAKGKVWLDVSPETHCTFAEEKFFSFDLKVGKETSKIYKIELPPGKYFVTTQSDYIGLRRDWKLTEIQWDIKDLSQYDMCDIKQYVGNLPTKGLYTFDGVSAGSISLAAYRDNLVVYAKIFDDSISGKIDKGRINKLLDNRVFTTENRPWERSGIEILTTNSFDYHCGDVLFLLPETTMGKATALINGINGPEIASELRTHLEVTYSFKNQPKVDKIGHAILQQLPVNIVITKEKTESGYNLLGVLPYKFLSIKENTQKFNLEIVVTTVLPGTDEYRAVTLFNSLNPKQCVQMFGKIAEEINYEARPVK